MSNTTPPAGGMPEIDVNQALESFQQKDRRVHRALKEEADEQGDPERGDPDVSEYFEKALTASSLGGPFYCRHVMRSTMAMCHRNLDAANANLKMGARFTNRETVAVAEIRVDACSTVLSFVEAVVLVECGV